ncbi:hypothetical protein D3C72_1200840 [compost metagenome]
MAGQLGQQRRLGRRRNLVTDMDVGHAGRHEGHGLADLLAADAHCAARDLRQRNLGALVRLGVRAQFHAGAVGGVLHARHVAREGGEVKDQGRCVDGIDGLAGDGGGRQIKRQGHGGKDVMDGAGERKRSTRDSTTMRKSAPMRTQTRRAPWQPMQEAWKSHPIIPPRSRTMRPGWRCCMATTATRWRRWMPRWPTTPTSPWATHCAPR